ncbi:hypothetical protein GCM10022261_06970 [Brevibacterium daeguense]|uniref:Uncharacterized protein n=1 Tax=Brevibacterium daeguense TaxID=909936 RepID=A0ABP8EGS4_9MICO|nr:hypothetical protein [Brevibacterium daeguense]
MSNTPRYHKPVKMPDLEHLEPQPDPATRAEAAHATASLLVNGCESRDRDATARFVRLADEIGLETIAEMWSSASAMSLAGTLWRLYVLRSWIRQSPSQAAEWFDAGREQDLTAVEVIAGIESPPGPDAVARAADEILAGAFTGEYATALARAASFVIVASHGRRALGDASRDADTFEVLGRDLAAAARARRLGMLD